jgi:hypothetical protein
MKKTLASILIALLLIALFVSATLAAPARGGRELPLRGSIEAIETYSVNFPIMSVTASGSGRAAQLGQFSVSYQVEVNLVTLAGIGSAQFVAANGDSIYANGIGQATETETPGVVNVVENFTITGGTGRFAGASGTITLDRVVDTNTGITSGVISGTLVLP